MDEESELAALPSRDPPRRKYQASSTKRVTVRVPEPLLAELEQLVEAGVFYNRSEALRAGLRAVAFGDYGLLSREVRRDG